MENIKGKLLEFIKTEHNLSIDFVERAKKFQGDIIYTAPEIICRLPLRLCKNMGCR